MKKSASYLSMENLDIPDDEEEDLNNSIDDQEEEKKTAVNSNTE